MVLEVVVVVVVVVMLALMVVVEVVLELVMVVVVLEVVVGGERACVVSSLQKILFTTIKVLPQKEYRNLPATAPPDGQTHARSTLGPVTSISQQIR